MKSQKTQILELRDQGLTYRKIQELLGCSKSTISYHCGEDQKGKQNSRVQSRRARNALIQKIDNFKTRTLTVNGKRKRIPQSLVANFNHDDVLKKFGGNPVCYLTGKPINLQEKHSYHLDHIIPACRGGSNELDNLGLASRDANHSKYDMLLEEYIELCKSVLENFGYTVTKS